MKHMNKMVEIDQVSEGTTIPWHVCAGIRVKIHVYAGASMLGMPAC